MLKKIIFEDFLNNNKLLIYHLCQQCFCFINKEIFFKKIIDCYHFYKKKNTDFILIKNILEFFNILVIESLIKKDKKMKAFVDKLKKAYKILEESKDK